MTFITKGNKNDYFMQPAPRFIIPDGLHPGLRMVDT